jgi:hypothetical protein
LPGFEPDWKKFFNIPIKRLYVYIHIIDIYIYLYIFC